jgi:L-fuconolactonase
MAYETIIDTHIHIYDPFRTGGAPWPDPKDTVIYKTTRPDRIKERAVPAGVTGAIVVECSPLVEDNQWVLDLAKDEPFLVGLVGNLNVHDRDFARNVARFSKDPLFRGIRARLWEPDDIDGLRVLADHDLALDVTLNPMTLKIAEAIPALRIVINHCDGLKMDGGPTDEGAAAQVRAAAAYPNVFMKMSGMMDLRCTIRPAPTDAGHYAPYLDVLWRAFGEDRMIFGSDWPVSDRSERSYADVLQLARDYVATKPATAWGKVFSGNATRAYKWVSRT